MRAGARFRQLLINFTFSVIITIVAIVAATRIYIRVVESRNSNYAQGADEDMFFKVAYIKYGVDQVKKVNIKSWRDFPTALNVQITDTNDVVYLTTYSNVLLISEDK